MSKIKKINDLINKEGLKNCHINHDGSCIITLKDDSVINVSGGNLDTTHVHVKTIEGEVITEDVSF